MKKNSRLSLVELNNRNTMPRLVWGFSLIEIVVVIAIIGLMSSVIYSSFDQNKAQSRDQKRVSDISSIQLALELYFNANGIYPLNLTALTTSNPKYISEIPKDPITSKRYDDIESSGSGYFPITKKDGSGQCISYHLWTTFEKSNPYIDQKRSFNSLPSGLPTNMYECIGLGEGENNHKRVNASNSSGALIYDVMP